MLSAPKFQSIPDPSLMTPPCIFCNQACRQVQWHKGQTEYYCTQCNVDYLGPNDYLSKIKFRTMLKNTHYELIVDTSTNTTVLGCWVVGETYATAVESDSFKVLLESPSALKGVTPSNLEDKIQTLLMFS